ncbi:MAG: hypothetical protein ACRC1P_09655 [Cellulosilyticaceae bacterium]
MKIKFENGSVIKTIDSQDNCRGKSAKIFYDLSDGEDHEVLSSLDVNTGEIEVLAVDGQWIE